MSKYDGKVTICTAIDNSGIEKDLQPAEGEFDGLTKTVKETEKAIDKAFTEMEKRKVKLTGFQYDGKEIEKFVNDYASGLNEVEKHTNGMRAAFEAAQKKVEDLEEQGFWWGDEEYEKAFAALDRVKKDIQEAQHFATTPPETKNPFGTDTIAGKLQEAKNRLATLSEAGKGLGTKEYDEAYAALSRLTEEAKEYQKSLTETTVPPGLDTYEGKIRSLENELRNLRNAGKGLGDPAYDEIYRKLSIAKNEAKKYAAELAKTPEEARKSAKELGVMGKSVNSFATRLKSIALGALLFNGISAGFREFTSYFGDMLKTNEAFTMELSRLKGALLTAFQPIYTAVAPAVVSLMRLLTSATMVVAEFFATITGTTIETNAEAAKGLYEEANAIGAVGKAAKKAGKTVAGFDELNVLQNKGESSGKTGASDATTPNFSVSDWAITDTMDKVRGCMEAILVLVGLIGAGILAWKIIDAYTASTSLVGAFKGVAAQALIIAGAVLLVTSYCDGWVNGVDWGNFALVLGGIAAILGGIHLKFGALATSIAAVAAGIALIILGVKDFINNGASLQNTILIIGGAIAIAVGLATAGLSVLVSAIIGAVAAVVAFTAAIILEEPAIMSVEEAQENLTAAKEAAAAAENNYINAVDAAESAMTRLKDAEEAAGVTGADLYAQVQNGTLDYANMTDAQKEVYKAYLDNEEKQKALAESTIALNEVKKAETLASLENEIALGKESNSYDKCKESIVNAFNEGSISAEEARDLLAKAMSEMSDDSQKTFMEDLPSDIKGGLDPNKYETTRKKMADWFSNVGKGFIENIWKPVKEFWNKQIAPIFTKKWWSDKFETIKEGAKSAFNGAIGIVENAINSIIKKINTLSWDIPDWVPVIGGGTFGFNFKEVKIPRLAKGAVIPPNQEFLAVLGDQKHGTNIEAPLSTIQEAVAAVTQDQTQAILAGFEASVGVQREILEAVLGIQIGDEVIGNAVARYSRKQAVMRGGAL